MVIPEAVYLKYRRLYNNQYELSTYITILNIRFLNVLILKDTINF